MIVKDTVRVEGEPRYRLEFGISTWTENQSSKNQTESVRNRYDTEEGRFSPHGSSEIPLGDIPLIITECLKRDKIPLSDMLEILHEVSNSINRRTLNQ